MKEKVAIILKRGFRKRNTKVEVLRRLVASVMIRMRRIRDLRQMMIQVVLKRQEVQKKERVLEMSQEKHRLLEIVLIARQYL
ncbi:hypothetical protein ANAPRD1_00099 [Anaplasma phagocytophilum]|nr:hypothetical protein ANAPRD1_00099 [Anaplasma phagocytophilum]SCV65494.1 hypothetical protein ANAPH1_00824 [Anaplasma phagocytophilum]